MNDNLVLKKNNEVVSREIEGEVILVPLYNSSKDMNYIYTLNETAARFWDLIDGKNTIGDIKATLLDEFEIEEDKLASQIGELVKDLKSVKAVVN